MDNCQSEAPLEGFNVAIIGMAGRFPGARDIAEFWKNISGGVESISFFSEEELRDAGVAAKVIEDRRYIRAAAIPDDVDQFDAAFFDINPKEAALLDPQHRLFLECAWEALEDAACDPEKYRGQIGVYGGVSFHPYLWSNLWDQGTDHLDTHLLKINLAGSLTGRVSYKLNLTGPSITIQSGCSTSLVAVHLACQSLLSYECDVALAGGVSVDAEAKGYFVQEGALSPDGHTRAFDARANGVVGGNGVALVTLKRLADALADGDHIYAVIKGSAVNNDGRFKIGYTAPSVPGQVRVILAAQAVAGVAAESISYIEAHGTGTPLGDSIELKALTQAFRATTSKEQFCAVGSVKTNIGHLDNAAGVTGLIKAALALHHKLLPPSLHFENPNPEFELAGSPFYINTIGKPWECGNSPRRAAVSSFGIGGTNAHAILEAAPPARSSSVSRSWQLVTMSAKTDSSLEAVTAQLAGYLKQSPKEKLADVAYTNLVGRRAFKHRRMCVCEDTADAVKVLETRLPRRLYSAIQEPIDRPMAFMFPGGGAQYSQMGRGLYQEERVFRQNLDSCAEILRLEFGFDLRQVLYSGREPDNSTTPLLFDDPAWAMSSIFTIEYSLARLYMSWGLVPAAMIGHSFGEYVAATLAGVISLPDALRLIVTRGKLFEQLDEGAMLGVPLPESEIEPLLGDQLSLASINGPSRCVVSGTVEAIVALEALLNARRIQTSRLQVNRAGHSAMVAPILEPFSRFLSQIELRPPIIPFISNVTGTWITTAQATDPAYWVSHLRRTVRFSDGVRELVKEPARILLEVGPGQMLSSLVRRQLVDKRMQLTLPSLRDANDKCDDLEFLLNTLGKLWLAGVQIDWDAFYGEEQRQRLSLPTYPFERKRYWSGTRQANTASTPALSTSAEIADWFRTDSWMRSAIPEEESSAQAAPCLIFVDKGGLGDVLVKRLEGTGRPVITVRAGASFRRVSESAYTINLRFADDYPALLSELADRNKFPGRIIYLCTELAEESYASLNSLLAAIEAQHLSTALKFFFVVSNTQEVIGGEPLQPGQAMMLGLPEVFSARNSMLSCRSIDVQAPWDERVVEQLLAEINSGASEPLVAYRGSHRWVQACQQIDKVSLKSDVSRLRKGGVYLVIYGLDGIGLRLAEYLAKNAGARLILTSHSELAANDERLEIDLAQAAERITAWESEIARTLSIQPIGSYAGLEEAFNSLCATYIYAFLNSGGPELQKGLIVSPEELAEALQIPLRFNHFLELFLTELSRDGIVRLREEGVEFLRAPSEMDDPEQLRQKLTALYPGFASSFWLLDHCVRSYPSVFSGAISANSVLYPDGSYEMLQGLSRSSVETSKSREYQHLLARTIADLAARTPRKLRILEVGAGTGILTELILNALDGFCVDYHFTDLGRSFVRDAEKNEAWRKLANLRCGVLDISEDPIAQGYERESYDVILAFDVVQATKDVSGSIGHLRSLLAPGGTLFLLQTLKAYRWQHLTFGLSPGWWNFKADPLRASSPVLSLIEWEAVLRRHQFASVQSFPRDTAAQSGAEFGMIVAQRSAEAATLTTVRTLGAEAMVVELDPSDSEQLSKVIERARAQFGEINGVFYTAPDSHSSDSVPGLLERRELHSLERVLHDMSFDFCLLLSTSSAIPGTPHLVAEASLRRFREAFVYQRNSTSKGDWVYANLDHGGLSPEETDIVFRNLLSLRRASHVYVVQPKSQSVHLQTPSASSPEIPEGSANIPSANHEIEKRVGQLWQELLGVVQVRTEDNFFELGGDSLIALQLVSRLRDIMKVEVSIADLFERPTLGELAESIAPQLTNGNAHQQVTEFSPISRGDDDLDNLLTQLEMSSDETVQALLFESTESGNI